METARPMTLLRLPSFLPCLAAWALASALPVNAQHSSTPPAAMGLSHDSVLSRYKRFEDPPVLPWREANDTVGRIGGWKAYAQEKAEGTAAQKATPEAAAPPPATPAPRAHQGHHTPKSTP